MLNFKDSKNDLSELVFQRISEKNYSPDDYEGIHSLRIARSLDYVISILDSFFKVHKSISQVNILEIGFNQLFAEILMERFPGRLNYSTFDYSITTKSKSLIEIVSGENIENVNCYHGNIETNQVPLEPGTQHFVLMCEVLEHFEVDPMAAIIEINRLLVDKGQLYITTPNICSANAVAKILCGSSPYFFMKYIGKLGRHNYEYSPGDLYELLKSGGFHASIHTEDVWDHPNKNALSILSENKMNISLRGDNLCAHAIKVSNPLDRYPDHIYERGQIHGEAI